MDDLGNLLATNPCVLPQWKGDVVEEGLLLKHKAVAGAEVG